MTTRLPLGEVAGLGNDVVDLGLGLLDDGVVGVLGAHAAGDRLDVALLGRLGGQGLDAHGAEQKAAGNKQAVLGGLLHGVIISSRLARRSAASRPCGDSRVMSLPRLT